MELSDIENKRLLNDNELEGFYDFVEVERIGYYRVVQREFHTYKGIIDERDNIIVPLIYDNIEQVGEYIKTSLIINKDVFVGIISNKSMCIMLPAKYKFINVLKEINVVSCYDGNSWTLVSLQDNNIRYLSKNVMPFDNEQFTCVLVRRQNNDYKIECWNDNENHSQDNLRQIAMGSSCAGRIKFTNKYFKLVVYTDIYGQILFANKDLNLVFK